jgi:hypothetical protein
MMVASAIASATTTVSAACRCTLPHRSRAYNPQAHECSPQSNGSATHLLQIKTLPGARNAVHPVADTSKYIVRTDSSSFRRRAGYPRAITLGFEHGGELQQVRIPG